MGTDDTWRPRRMPDDLWNEIPDPPMHYDRLGEPITLREWAALIEDRDYARIAHTTVGRWRISTVWLGNDHNWYSPPGLPHIPIIYETMIFQLDDTPAEEWELRRYATEDEARHGHAEMVQLVTELEDAGP